MTSARDLTQQARQHPYQSDMRRQLLLQAVNQADAESDIDLAFELRTQLINALHRSPDTTQMVAAFGWCLSRQDEDSERFNIDLWYYKWIIEAMLSSANTTRAQMAGMIEDMDRRFAEDGASRGPVLKAKLHSAKRFDRERVPDMLGEWRDSHRVHGRRLNDCAACDAATEASAWADIREHDRAVKAADSLLNGKARCGAEPESTLGTMLEPLRALGQYDEADMHHQKGLSLIESTLSDYPATVGKHLRHMAVRGFVDDGLDLMFIAYPKRRIDDRDWFDYLRGARLLLLAADVKNVVHPEADKLRDGILGEVIRIADAFDRGEDADFNTRLLDTDAAELTSSST